GSDRVNGERLSYGCLRISVAQARQLSRWVSIVGPRNVRLHTYDTDPS
ncbi:MAG: hypothetical protein HRT44_13475, partial [Bdellovibrionales bacterium]|nr:hypothetical protein [Bdellovibrionales bacterium]